MTQVAQATQATMSTVDERMLILIDIEKLMTSRDMALTELAPCNPGDSPAIAAGRRFAVARSEHRAA